MQRFIEHDDHVDIEENFGGIWAVTRCSFVPRPRRPTKQLKPHQTYYIEHKKEINDRQKKERKNNFPNKDLGINSKYAKYGMSNEDYQRMNDEQNGVCAICGNPPRKDKKLVVDHCHNSGKVRKLLCNRCNVGIGLLQDSPTILQIAIDYIKSFVE